MKLCTIIPAAGSGKRFGSKKQFANFCGKPVLLRSIEKFHALSRRIIVLLPEQDVDVFKKSWSRLYPKDTKLIVLTGGKERYDTVKIALCHVPPDCGLVAIHDAVRPLIKSETIKTCINQAAKHGAAITAVLSKDTVKLADRNEFVCKTIPRQNVWLVQTPQVFKTKIVTDAYAKVTDFTGITDDSMVVERAGYKVKLVMGNYSNIKITDKQDLAIAVRLLKH
jgi:2-C-methyl-D-erythritol 4-phosphate cytidylyltransferase